MRMRLIDFINRYDILKDLIHENKLDFLLCISSQNKMSGIRTTSLYGKNTLEKCWDEMVLNYIFSLLQMLEELGDNSDIIQNDHFLHKNNQKVIFESNWK